VFRGPYVFIEAAKAGAFAYTFIRTQVKLFPRHMKVIALRIGASIREIFLRGCVSKPDPAKPLAAEWYYAKEAARGQRLFVFLPGRRDRAADFVRHGFVTMAQRRVSGLDCMAVDATIGYYLDGSVAERLHREIISPARAFRYHEIWLVGVSMGGLGAFFHERVHPGEIAGLILLAPFVGEDRKLFAEIDAAGGAAAWAAAQPAGAVPGNKATYQRDLWRFLGRLPCGPEPRLQIWVAYGDHDRLLPGIERLRTVIPAERVFRLAGGHTWEVWTTGFDQILAKIDWQPEVRRQESEVRSRRMDGDSPSPVR
jgi:pimeloyl-ACP methyl ester carboxylesterase